MFWQYISQITQSFHTHDQLWLQSDNDLSKGVCLHYGGAYVIKEESFLCVSLNSGNLAVLNIY